MGFFFFTALAFLVALGVLITVHEFGHFWVARKLGVKVLRFSVGFGRPLWKHVGKVDGTEYVVAAIPLGGYVKMLDEREAPVAPAELAMAFNRQSLKVRTAVVLAGPLFNFLFAIFAYWLILVSGDTGMRPLIGEVEPESIAANAGFAEGDEILAVGDRKTPTWETAVYALLAESLGDTDLPVRVRDDQRLEKVRWLEARELADVTEDGQVLERIGLSPKRPLLSAVIGEVIAGEAAARAGLQTGDELLSVDGVPLKDWGAWVAYVREHPDQQMSLDVKREGVVKPVQLTTSHRVDDDGTLIGRIGAGVYVPKHLHDEYRTEIRLGPVDAAGAAVKKTWDLSVLMLRMLGKMLIGEASVKNLSGPISIAESAGRSASYGLVYFLKFLAVVSISLGVLNLLPVPILDGGHLLYFLIEALKGSPLSESAQIQGQRIGIMILLGLMTLAFYVDISRLLGYSS